MLSNQDKKEVLEMIAECVRNATDMRDLAEGLSSKASSLLEDKPYRKMPSIGDSAIYLNRDRNPFALSEAIWYGTAADKNAWSNGFFFSLSERELAEKKVEELNRVLKS